MRSIILVFLVLFGWQVKAQSSKDSVVEKSGYLVFINKGWVFKPCVNDTAALWKAAKEASFVPGTKQDSRYKRLPATGIGTPLPVSVLDRASGTTRQDTIFYFYCTTSFRFVGASQYRSDSSCRYEVTSANNGFSLVCCSVPNIIVSIKPREAEDKKAYVKYLIDVRELLPSWTERNAGQNGRVKQVAEAVGKGALQAVLPGTF
ncbi:hypothetical protein [uncultured Chitinophaga sp.]|uniref:hypothetical protein n=1 Tax=uncultured Chitinophaga sp. TaxID=339340 RepID=UPI0025ED2723|nr:hypothetical protein [uncultured Chitinophaga sp.]